MKTNIIFKCFLIIILLGVSCSEEQNSRNKREIEIDKIKNKSLRYIAVIQEEINRAEKNGDEIYFINLDSVRNTWQKIHSDSAELGFEYIQKIDSTFLSENNKIDQEEFQLRKESLVQLKKEFEKLKNKFTYKYDDFKGGGFYTHKTFGKYKPRRKTLTSGVNSEGYYWLRSNYYSNDWLFHHTIQVLIGEMKYTSEKVESYENNNIHDNSGGKVYEQITFNDISILKQIAQNTDQKIKIRFIGDKYHDDATLSSKDKQALKDCYELGEIIKKMNRY